MMNKVFKLEERTSGAHHFYVARCPLLGLTAYGENPNAAWDKLKKMLDVLVDICKGVEVP